MVGSREAFEAWYCKKHSIDSQARKVRLHINATGRYSSSAVQKNWEIWKSAWCEAKAIVSAVAA